MKKTLIVSAVALTLFSTGAGLAQTNQAKADAFYSNTKNYSTTDADKILQSNRVKSFEKAADKVKEEAIYTALAAYGVAKPLVQQAINGSRQGLLYIYKNLGLSKHLTDAQKRTAMRDFDTLVRMKRQAIKKGVWVTSSNGNTAYTYKTVKQAAYNNPKSAKSHLTTGVSEQIVKVIKYRSKGTVYKLVDGSYVKDGVVKIDKSITNVNDLAKLNKKREVYAVYVDKAKASPAYYKSVKKNALVKVKKAVKVYKTKSAKTSRVQFTKGEVVRALKAVRTGKSYRLALTNGKFITANKSYVAVK